MKTEINPRPIKLIKSIVGCDVNQDNLHDAFKEEIDSDGITRQKVQHYITHAEGFHGLKTKYASNFHIEKQIAPLLGINGASFLRFYLAIEKDVHGNEKTVTLLAATDKDGKVLTLNGIEQILVFSECCGNPPGNSKFDHDPFL